ncbi:2-(hydroxymethyl)glutarate dehydrogenase [Oligella urethralis]|uniref:3-hydroxyisobutyrate dehydrogenase n=1 Tax=Oligella urethralis TaxID=90245 RepID=UPI000E05FE6D|nr:3-hydroxyisobutyrate dehydrogenase [Oligella urethralis]SUA55302.1 2-(hydroxymethyl)glutarate dehydrogenase [Oligella urethralis]
MRIGFIGLGNMGGPMALNLAKAGYELTVFDLSAEAIAHLQEKAQISVANSPVALAEAGQDVIVTMLPAAAHVKSVYLGDDGASGIIAASKPGTILIDSSTIDPGSAREVAEVAEAKGVIMLDAPVSGGTVGAQNATLTFMVGGSEAGFAKAKPILEAMGKNIVYCGEHGNGQVAKVANNMLLGISMIGVAEAMNLGVKLGMDPKILAGIINTSSGRCWSSEVNNPWPGVIETAPAGRDYQGGFFTDLMLKDMGLALEAAAQSESAVPMGSLAHALYKESSEAGNSRSDFSSIIKHIQSK